MNLALAAGSRRTAQAAGLVLLALLLAACSPIRSLAALTRSTDHFVPSPLDGRILVEPRAERFAALLAPYVAGAIKTVETAHDAPFKSEIRIHVCATDASFHQLTGQRSAATTTDKVFLSPDLFRSQRPLDRYLTHELSHLHLVQRVGLLGGARLPEWFKEGLAELVSGGATASSVAMPDALRALTDGHRFTPDEGRNAVSSFLFPHYGTYWNIENRMFYRQSMLFVQFLRDHDEVSFARLLVAVERGDDFGEAFRRAYSVSVGVLWVKFLENARVAGGLEVENAERLRQVEVPLRQGSPRRPVGV